MIRAVRMPEGKKTKLPIAGTPAAPTVTGRAEIEYRGGRSRIKLTLDQLPDPRQTGTYNTSYVAWVVRDDHGIENLAEIPMKKQTVLGSTAARTLGVIITAEPYGSVRQPSSTVIAELALPQSSDPQLPSTTITYEGVPEGLYDDHLLAADCVETRYAKSPSTPRKPAAMTMFASITCLAKGERRFFSTASATRPPRAGRSSRA